MSRRSRSTILSAVLGRLALGHAYVAPQQLQLILTQLEDLQSAKKMEESDRLESRWGIQHFRTEDGAHKPYQISGSTAIISGTGVMMKHGGWYDLDYETLESAVRAASGESAVRTVVLNLVTPGGTVIGLAECSQRLHQIREETGVEQVLFSDYLCASAGYHIGAHMTIIATPSAMVGSIGSIWVKMHMERWLEELGVDVDVYKSGRLKDMGSPFRAPTEEEAALFQAEVDECGEEFRAWVRLNRAGIDEETMQGQVFTGRHAAGVGLVDGIVNDLPHLLAVIDSAS